MPAFDAMVAALHDRTLGVVVDIVPNHMTVPEPEHLNAPLWSMLREGRESAYATWFDVDWDAAGDRIVIPVLGGTVDEALASGDLVSVADGGPDGDEAVVRYYDHELPVRPGTEDLPLAELLDRQWWRLESWRARGEHPELPPVLRRGLAGRRARRGARRVRRDPRPGRRPRPRGVGRRPAHRPPGRAGRPARVPAPARRGDGRRVGRRREDPRGRRAAARRLAVRRYDRVRPAAGASAPCSSTRPASSR